MISYLSKKCKAFGVIGNDIKKLKKGYIFENGEYKKIYSAGNIVTYYVDTGEVYQEEVDEGMSCIHPTSFTPTKDGWIFVGWRVDDMAAGSVFGSEQHPDLLMADEPVSLYAVFKKAVTVTRSDNTVKDAQTSKDRYYNNGNVENPIFSFTQTAASGWTSRGWSTSNTGNATIAYANSTTFTRDSDVTLYASYQQTITVTYYDTTTAATKTGTRYWGIGGTINPSFTLTQTNLSSSGWTARGWSTGTAGNSDILYKNATAFTRDTNVTLYGMYQQTITVTYYNGSTTASTTTGTRYYNRGKGVFANPSFTLTQATKSGWSAAGWTTGTAGNSGITYNNATAFTRESNVTLYGRYNQTITLSYNGNGSTGGSTASHTGTRCWNSGKNVYVNPSFTLKANGFVKTGNVFTKWANGSTSGTQYAAGASVTLSANTTFYAIWTNNKNLLTKSLWTEGTDTGQGVGTRSFTTNSSGHFVMDMSVTNDNNGSTFIQRIQHAEDLTNFKTLRVVGTTKRTGTSAQCWHGIDIYNSNWARVSRTDISPSSDNTVTSFSKDIDVSSMSGTHYIQIRQESNRVNKSCNTTVTQCALYYK